MAGSFPDNHAYDTRLAVHERCEFERKEEDAEEQHERGRPRAVLRTKITKRTPTSPLAKLESRGLALLRGNENHSNPTHQASPEVPPNGRDSGASSRGHADWFTVRTRHS
jgi:hypothetical protein